MKSLAFFNNKGGVGKTTSVINVGYILGEVKNKKVLIVDCDGQQNSSRFFEADAEIGVESILLGEAQPEDIVTGTRYENIDILPSTADMNLCSSKFEKLSEEERENNTDNLKNFWSKYDYVLLDFPPTLNLVSESLIRIAGNVIVPVKLGSFAIQGISKVTETINKAGSTFLGCFITQFNAKNKADFELKDIMENSFGDKIFSTIIPSSNIIQNSIIYNLTAYEYMNWQLPSKKYVELTDEIIERMV